MAEVLEYTEEGVGFECREALLELEPMPLRERVAVSKCRPSLDGYDAWAGSDYYNR